MASSDVWNNAVMGRVAVSVSLGLALLLSGCSSGVEISNAPTTTAAPTTTEGVLTPAEEAWIDTQIEEARTSDASVLDQMFAGPGLTEAELGCMLTSLLARWGLDDLRRVWAGYDPNPYSGMAEGYIRSLVEAIDACADLRDKIMGGVDSVPMNVVECWMGAVSDEIVVEMTVLSMTVEYDPDPSSQSELIQFTMLKFFPPLLKCAEELLPPEEFEEFLELFS